MQWNEKMAHAYIGMYSEYRRMFTSCSTADIIHTVSYAYRQPVYCHIIVGPTTTDYYS